MRRPAIAFTLVAVLAGCGERDVASIARPLGASATLDRSNNHLTVMTRNLYLGADIDPIVGAQSPEDVPRLAAVAWAMVHQTNFPARAGAIADEIRQADPDLVGLQEATLFQVQSPSDAVFGGTTPATTVELDYVAILLDSLRARGLNYRVVAIVNSTTNEVPVALSPTAFEDVRVTLRDAILARSDIEVGNTTSGIYAAAASIPIGVPDPRVPPDLWPSIRLQRGWTSVDVVVGGSPVRVINTHLEPDNAPTLQEGQARELVQIADRSPIPVIVMGDFNSRADGLGTHSYELLRASGLNDAWTKVGEPGFTGCQTEDLLNPVSGADQRIDIVFTGGDGLDVVGQPRVVGDKQSRSTGLWPSDHFGVVATVKVGARP